MRERKDKMEKKPDKKRLPLELEDPKVPIIHGDTPVNQAERYRSSGPYPCTGPWILPDDWPPVER